MKLNLIGNERDRQYAINQGYKTKGKLINMLKKFGQVADYMTEPMVAKFYGVGTEVIHKLSTRNKEELKKYGYKVYKREEILKGQTVLLENIPNRGLRLYPIEAVLFIGLNYLTDNKIADEIKHILPEISPSLFLELSKGKSIKRKEIDFLNQLEDALKPFNIQGIRQYRILSYQIDYYIPSLNIAIEYDENEHKNYTYEAHEGRQQKIEKELGCKFIRVTDKKSNAYNIGLIIKQIFNL